jgi:hypothetical protein
VEYDGLRQAQVPFDTNQQAPARKIALPADIPDNASEELGTVLLTCEGIGYFKNRLSVVLSAEMLFAVPDKGVVGGEVPENNLTPDDQIEPAMLFAWHEDHHGR